MPDDDIAKEILAHHRLQDEKFLAARDREVAKIAEQLLAVRPAHGDTIHLQFPPSAGVVREALRRAFNAGVNSIALVIVEEYLAQKKR